MTYFVKLIGVLDKNEKTHFVEFSRGLNIITGKSSTGKSAIIEIFDYCMGSSKYNVPNGIITDIAKYYFIILQSTNHALLVARDTNPRNCFLKELSLDEVEIIKTLKSDFFSTSEIKYDSQRFRKQLGGYFQITLDSIEESYDTPKDRNSPTPSVRSLVSFMLQHQNLIANKHAIFYRFDEKEKREQVIEHFKILMGVVTPEYFYVMQEIDRNKQELNRITKLLAKQDKEEAQQKEKINNILNAYSTITGTSLINWDLSKILKEPKEALHVINKAAIKLDILKTEYEKQRQSLEQKLSEKTVQRRALNNKLNSIKKSIDSASSLQDQLNSIVTPDSIEIADNECPFCNSTQINMAYEANKLANAIDWLNHELHTTNYFIGNTFFKERKSIISELKQVKDELKSIQSVLENLDKQDQELQSKRSLHELAMKEKLRLEILLDNLTVTDNINLEKQKTHVIGELKKLEGDLKKFNLENYPYKFEKQIEAAMRDIGSKFDFEESYKPINLKFSLKTFDLWHEKKHGTSTEKVFLRSMGSGANWLYSHLTLFLALHRLFALNQPNCRIPPILFLDQPTQVYFPSFFNDTKNEFNATDLVKVEEDESENIKEKRVDADIEAVKSMFNEFIRFCDETEEVSGIRPQIIVSDHVDNLDLENNESTDLFESFVQGRRWRTRGFIN